MILHIHCSSQIKCTVTKFSVCHFLDALRLAFPIVGQSATIKKAKTHKVYNHPFSKRKDNFCQVLASLESCAFEIMNRTKAVFSGTLKEEEILLQG